MGDCWECPHEYTRHHDLAGCAVIDGDGECDCTQSKASLDAQDARDMEN